MMKVAELTGPELDYWTGKAIGLDVELVDAVGGGKIVWANHTFYDPHEDWNQGGPLIHEKRIHIAKAPDYATSGLTLKAKSARPLARRWQIWRPSPSQHGRR